jgi:hypothetical protein
MDRDPIGFGSGRIRIQSRVENGKNRIRLYLILDGIRFP